MEGHIAGKVALGVVLGKPLNNRLKNLGFYPVRNVEAIKGFWCILRMAVNWSDFCC